jgi:putative membrane protein
MSIDRTMLTKVSWMKVTPAATLGAVMLIATLGACKRSQSTPDTTMGAITSTDSALVTGVGETSGMASQALTDAEIFAILDEINESEIELGELAQDKATNADVKSFAREMVMAHRKMEDEGEALSKRLGVSPKSEANDSLEAANDATNDRLESLAKGITFDTAYVNSQVMGHEKAIAFLNRAGEQVTSAELKTLIEGAKPNVQRHLDRARTLQTSLMR